MIDDATVFRLGQDNFRFVGGDDYDGVWLKEQAERAGPSRLGEAVHRPAPQPRRPGTAEPRDPAAGSCGRRTRNRRSTSSRGSGSASAGSATSDGVPIIVSRTGYTGELGLRGLVPPGRRRRPSGMRSGRPDADASLRRPFGLDALDIVRIEAGLIVSGQRVRRPDRPVRGGHRVHRDLANDEDFVGRAALRRTVRASAARPGGAAARRQRDRRRTGTRCTSGGSRSASSRAGPGPRS